jgi:hypothetical protein
MDRDIPYAKIGGYSVKTTQKEVQDAIGHCLEPTPTGTPVFVYSGQVAHSSEHPEGALLFSYPDHVAAISDLLGVAIPGEPDGSSGGSPAGFVVDSQADYVPQSVTATQIRVWLVKSGVSLSSIDSAIADIQDTQERELARVYWEYAPYIERTNPLVSAIGTSLGMTSSQIDQGFREASLL